MTRSAKENTGNDTLMIEQLVEELFIYHALQTDREREVLRQMVIAEFTDQLHAGIVAHIADKTGRIN